MPRYEDSKDADLKKSLQHTREKQFFLGQYRKRKFVTDKSALFDKTVSDEEKRCCGLTDMTHLEINNTYKSLVCKVNEAIFFRDCVTLVDITNPDSFKHRTNEVAQTINGLQWHLVVYENKLAQSEISPPCLYNREYCQFLLKDKEIYDIVEKLTCVSFRYGLLITDLCSDFTVIDINQDVDVDDPSLFMLFYHYLDFDQARNLHVLREGGCLQRSRLIKYYNDIIFNKKIGRLEASAAKKALTDILPGSFYSNSVMKRRAGLWLWDKCENPLTKKNITKTEAIQILLSDYYANHSDVSSLIREIHRVYDVTRRSIMSGEILPIESNNTNE